MLSLASPALYCCTKIPTKNKTKTSDSFKLRTNSTCHSSRFSQLVCSGGIGYNKEQKANWRRNLKLVQRVYSVQGAVEPDSLDEDELDKAPAGFTPPVQMWGNDPPGHKSGYVAIIGRPNAGKSTLMNSFVGAKLSIVTYKPQTTRHRVLGIVSDEDSQMILLDTPGVVDTKRNKMETLMMKSVSSSIKDADVVLALVDAAGRSPKEALDGMLPPSLLKSDVPFIIVLNKLDIIPEEELSELVEFYKSEWSVSSEREVTVVTASAREGTGLEDLLDRVKAQMPRGPSLYPKDIISEHPERFFIAEIIREQLFLQYRQELPYSSTVVVTEYEERKGHKKDHIVAEVQVDRDGQKGIIIGKGGSALKRLSSKSRKEIEDFIGKGVFLELIVKVKKGWMEDDSMLKMSGLMKNTTASSGLS